MSAAKTLIRWARQVASLPFALLGGALLFLSGVIAGEPLDEWR